MKSITILLLFSITGCGILNQRNNRIRNIKTCAIIAKITYWYLTNSEKNKGDIIDRDSSGYLYIDHIGYHLSKSDTTLFPWSYQRIDDFGTPMGFDSALLLNLNELKLHRYFMKWDLECGCQLNYFLKDSVAFLNGLPQLGDSLNKFYIYNVKNKYYRRIKGNEYYQMK